MAIDGHRLLTGDMEGYVSAWDLDNVKDPEVGSDKLCMRAHNAMDPVVFDRNTEKPVYGVHLEQASMIQVYDPNSKVQKITVNVQGGRMHRSYCRPRLLAV